MSKKGINAHFNCIFIVNGHLNMHAEAGVNVAKDPQCIQQAPPPERPRGGPIDLCLRKKH